MVDDAQLVGMVSLHDLLMARVRSLNEERKRERVLRLRLPFGSRKFAAEKGTDKAELKEGRA